MNHSLEHHADQFCKLLRVLFLKVYVKVIYTALPVTNEALIIETFSINGVQTSNEINLVVLLIVSFRAFLLFYGISFKEINGGIYVKH